MRLLDLALELVQRPNRIDSAANVSPLAFVRGSQIHGPVSVGDHARLFRVQLHGRVEVGTATSLWGPRILVDAGPYPITFGNYCSIATDVSFHAYGHDPRRLSTHYIGRNVLGRPIADEIVSKGPIAVGHDVWIGTGVRVMSGVTIGTGAIIGAGSIVTRDIPPFAIAVGAPARPVRYRFDEPTIQRILESGWWFWDREQIRQKPELFTQQLTPELIARYI